MISSVYDIIRVYRTGALIVRHRGSGMLRRVSWQHEPTLKKGHRKPSASPVPVLRVLFVPEGDAPVARPLREGERVAVGRAVDPPDLVLRDPHLSRRHAVLACVDGAVRVEDHSSNGTFVDGHRIDRVAELGDGAVVRAGDSLVMVRWELPGMPDAAHPELVGGSPAMRELRSEIETVGASDATVLVLGETGTGKELVARALHARSRRRGPLVAMNCSAIPEQLAESHLFGHVSGAFTGATRDHAGVLRAASGGTLFLDEIGDLPTTLQPKLLRALEERAVMPVGATRAVPIDVRVVAATHADLAARVEAGSFRGDLYARLAEITLTTTPLRERREDVLPIVRAVLGADAPPISADLAERLVLHAWRFNVRELVKVAKELEVRGAHLPELTLALVEARLPPPPPPAPSADEEPPDRERFLALARAHRGNVSGLSRALGRSRRQVYRYAEGFGVDLDALRDG